MRISGRSALLAATLATSTMACLADPAESPRTGATEQALDSSVALHENFFADGDPGQCGGTGMQSAAMGNWTSNVLIDTDNRSGGCQQQFGVTDPEGLLPGLSLAVNFFGDGDAGQCGNSGLHPIPITNITTPSLSTPYGIDTDGRSGGCWQVFSLSGRSDVVMDVQFLPTADGGQCGNSGTQTATTDRNASFRIDTDNRSGGCTERLRLRRPFCGDGLCYNESFDSCPSDCPPPCGDGICSPGETCFADCGRPPCGDGFCDFGEIDTCPMDCGVCDGRFCELGNQ
jgi:hypothetical protein